MILASSLSHHQGRGVQVRVVLVPPNDNDILKVLVKVVLARDVRQFNLDCHYAMCATARRLPNIYLPICLISICAAISKTGSVSASHIPRMYAYACECSVCIKLYVYFCPL
jgi:hypothetical protein